MSFLDKFRPWRGANNIAASTGYESFELADIFDFRIDTMTVEELYKTQPHLRIVTEFIARQVSSVSLHVYRREADGGRTRVRDSDLAGLMVKSSKSQLMMQLIHRSVMDLCLYDEWIWVYGDDPDGNEAILPIPPRWVRARRYSNPWTFEGIEIYDPGRHENVFISADQLIYYHGYNPNSLIKGVSPVDALKDVLKQNVARAEYQVELWRRGPRMAGFITRPMEAKWDRADRARFKADLRSQFSAGGSGAGGIALLEDGMKYEGHHLSADDEKVVEQTKLSLETVAQVYHVNPTMVGILDNANYSNVKEFRQSLYGDSLLQIMKGIEQSINAYLLPMMGEKPGDVYVEFNLDERLRSRFEERAAVTSAAVGAPWMTVNEAREQNNLPKLEGGDDLARPLNTGFGSDAAPADADDDEEGPDD